MDPKITKEIIKAVETLQTGEGIGQIILNGPSIKAVIKRLKRNRIDIKITRK